MASGLITSFLGEGLAAARPADPDVGSAIAFYWATDTNEMSAWLENAWVEDVFGTGGALLVANNLSDLANAATARTNLGLGSLATLSNLDLNDLGDVDTTGVADGDVLTYDSGTGDWLPAASSGGGGDAGVLHLAHVTLESAGPSTANTWASRGLNTEVSNSITGATSLPTSTVTITIASPGVVTWNSHGLSNGTPIQLTTTGALPTGLSQNIIYYVVNAGANDFQLSSTSGGAAINTSGSQSGTHTAKAGQFELPAGTYDIEAFCQGIYSAGAGWRSRLYNVTDGAEQTGTIGTSAYGSVNTDRYTNIKGRFTIASAKVFQIQTFCSASITTWGFGVDASFASSVENVFTNTMIRKIS